jgi:hypothetical protein
MPEASGLVLGMPPAGRGNASDLPSGTGHQHKASDRMMKQAAVCGASFVRSIFLPLSVIGGSFRPHLISLLTGQCSSVSMTTLQ